MFLKVNEAFACQVLAVKKELNLDDERLNKNGGAIAMGHPLGYNFFFQISLIKFLCRGLRK